ncbi:uncharacterized protein JCM15063_003924 [Sporobolomyces koalae]|uniref:uncharacterized protein n=1 Tax=Sporobolomyces koalae TaxID=500713 RepID=UPI0031792EB4
MPSVFKIDPPPASPLGDTVPALTPHAVSVSLPTWQDVVDYEEGEQRIKDAMTSGYPRFFIHHQIQKLADLTTARFGRENEACILLHSARSAQRCSDFLASRSPSIPSRTVDWLVKSTASAASLSDDPEAALRNRTITVHACFFDKKDFSFAKQYWQHTGEGIQSRVGERCLILLGEAEESEAGGKGESRQPQPRIETSAKANAADALSKPNGGRYGAKGSRYQVAKGTATPPLAGIAPSAARGGRYSTSKLSRSNSTQLASDGDSGSEPHSLSNSIDSLPPPVLENGTLAVDQDEDVLARYVEERYGRNLDLSLAPLAKLAMRRRIAGVLAEQPGQAIAVEDMQNTRNAETTRGVQGLTEDDVWLYSCGMNAIFHAHQLVMGTRESEGKPIGKSVCFGFPYTDTLKILEKWGPGAHFLGNGLVSDLDELRFLLRNAETPILSLFCEFPSNPLLRSPPLAELRKLADEFGFFIVVDETIAGFVNVETLPPVDIVVSSLTKVFSGDSNVMGGSLVLNPKGPFYEELKAQQEATYEDTYFDEDVIYMERNSRDFQLRVTTENTNAEMMCEYFRSRRSPGPSPNGVVAPPGPDQLAANPESFVLKEVYYPKYMTPEHYEASLRPPNPATNFAGGGYGALFSLTFTSILASRTFFDALPCYKGPSLGTNFTLSCPYTILAHYGELDWAKGWGVEKGLIRISVGLEDPELLLEWAKSALGAAEEAVRQAKEKGEVFE